MVNRTGSDAFAEGDSWRLFDWSGLASQEGVFSSTVLPELPAHLVWDLGRLYSDGILSVGVVPEPGRAALLALSLAASLLRRRRGGLTCARWSGCPAGRDRP